MSEEYQNRIKSLLKDVLVKAEPKVVEKVVAEPKIEVKTKLKEIFKLEESDEHDDEIHDSGYFTTKHKDQFPDVDSYWKSLLPYLIKIGSKNETSFGHLTTNVYDQEGKNHILSINVVRDSKNNEKPHLLLHYDDDSIKILDAINYIKSVGLMIDRIDCKDLGNGKILLSVKTEK